VADIHKQFDQLSQSYRLLVIQETHQPSALIQN